jgi:hypothetical protein
MRLTLATIGFVLLTQTAAAQSITTATIGFTYFNRPGATSEQHFADLEACRQQVRRVSPPFGGSGALEVAIEGAVVMRRGRAANFENCMVVKGWRVARVRAELAQELDRLDRDALGARLEVMVGADIPESEIVRRFGNDATNASVHLFERPGAGDQISLSVKAMPEREAWTDEERDAERELARSFGRMPRSARPPEPLRGRALSSLPADAAVIVIHVGMPMRSPSANPYFRSGVIFERVPQDNRPAWSTDGLPNVFFAKPPGRLIAAAGDRLNEGTLVFSVPPGRWRLVAMNQIEYSISFCLGSPSFEIAAGEVVYAGAYYTDLRPRGPDMSLERAREALADAPNLAQRLRAAVYENGDTFNCAGAYLYAYEIEGAPFRQNYTWGSAASAMNLVTDDATPAAP